ncbi:hypothetical protein AAHE18_14G084900 [Arachis hypogaea]
MLILCCLKSHLLVLRSPFFLFLHLHRLCVLNFTAAEWDHCQALPFGCGADFDGPRCQC